MDLMKYRKYIANKILDDYNQNAIKTRQMDNGAYKPQRKGLVKGQVVADVDTDDMIGGKFHFVKSLKSAGKSIGKDAVKVANTTKNVALKTGASLAGKEAGTYIYNGLKEAGQSAMQYAPEIGEEAGMTVAENPELLMMAAGMKKPKQKRQLSQKQLNRNKLVKALMDKHGISLPEASKYVKDHNLNY